MKTLKEIFVGGVLMLVKDNDDDDVMLWKEKWLAAFLNIASLFRLLSPLITFTVIRLIVQLAESFH